MKLCNEELYTNGNIISKDTHDSKQLNEAILYYTEALVSISIALIMKFVDLCVPRSFPNKNKDELLSNVDYFKGYELLKSLYQGVQI